jgi:acyl-CoA synthetase (AMP-forming)/AMP-acid ligase II
VLPEEVESALMQFKEIKDCVAYEKKNPIVGSLLAADIILQPNSKLSVAEIKAKLGSIFPEYKIPQFYRFVDEIKISENGKKIRN